MKGYVALNGDPPNNNWNLRQVLTPVIGAHRGAYWSGGRLVITTYNPADVRATANSVQAGLTYAVNAAALPTANDFLSVSGLTSCIGVMVLRSNGGNFTHGVTAHFNGNYDNVTAWSQISAGVTGIAGTLYAVVISTSDTSTYWQSTVIIPQFRGHLQHIGVSDAHIFFYHSCRSGVAYIIRRDGIMGEPNNLMHFSY